MNSRAIHLDITKSSEPSGNDTVTLILSLREPPVWQVTNEHATVSLSCIEKFCTQASEAINGMIPKGMAGQSATGILKDLGTLMCNDLFTPTLRKRLRETDKKILILTMDEDLVHVPWELIYLDEQFLCLQFFMGRWVKTQWDLHRSARKVSKNNCKMWIIANPGGDLPSAGKEGLNIFRKISSLKSPVATAPLSCEASRDDLLLKLTDFDIVHFAGHVLYDQKDPSASAIKLKDSIFKAGDLAKLAGGSAMPSLVFLNACQSAYTQNAESRSRNALTTFGLTDALIRSGVQHYIGAIWKVSDNHSSNFALNFYDYFFAGYSVGEAVNLARKKSAETKNDFSWASYVLYGDPQDNYFPETSFSPLPLTDKKIHSIAKQEKIRTLPDSAPPHCATVHHPMAINKKLRIASVLLACIAIAGLLALGRNYIAKTANDPWPSPVTMSVSVMQPSDDTAKFAAHVLESELHEKCPHIQLLERTDWQLLKQEYDIVASKLVPRRNKITPELLAATLFLIIDVNTASKTPVLLMRLAETKTGIIKNHFNEPLPADFLTRQKGHLCDKLVKALNKAYPLKGRIAGVEGRTVVLDIGYDQGVRAGQRFEVLENKAVLKIEKSDDIKARKSIAVPERTDQVLFIKNWRVRRI